MIVIKGVLSNNFSFSFPSESLGPWGDDKCEERRVPCDKLERMS